MATVKQTAMRFTPEDLSYLDAIVVHLREMVGQVTRSDAMRVAIRHYVKTNGLDVKRKRAK